MSGIFGYDLGDQVKDTVTGIKGTVTSRTEWLNGCIRYCIESAKDGDVKENFFDEDRLELVKAKNPPERTKPRTGGARPAPKRTGA
jgi:hypothetical protein